MFQILIFNFHRVTDSIKCLDSLQEKDENVSGKFTAKNITGSQKVTREMLSVKNFFLSTF